MNALTQVSRHNFKKYSALCTPLTDNPSARLPFMSTKLDGEKTMEFFSCRRTPSDENFLMVRSSEGISCLVILVESCLFPSSCQIKFQIFCLITAIISLRHIRREKVVNASLFEQRGRRRIKQEMTVLNSNINNNGKGNISDALTVITSFGSQEGETAPMLGNVDNADQA